MEDFDEKIFDENIKRINSSLFNSLLECEDGKEYFLKNSKMMRLYQLACIKLGLVCLTKIEQDYLMSDELNYLDFSKMMDKNLDYEEASTNIELFKRYLSSKKDDTEFCSGLDMIKIIELVGREYIFYYEGNFNDELLNMKNLVCLKLTSNNGDYSSIRLLTSLKILYLWMQQIKSKDYSFLSSLVQLEELDLINNSINNFSFLGSLKKLKKLNLSCIEFKDCSLLESLTQIELEDLDLSYNGITDISFLASLITLKKLDLHYNNITNASSLNSLKRLKNLDLSQNPLGNCDSLALLTQLEDLDLYMCNLENCSSLSLLVNLKKLDLGENGLNDCSLLASLTQLEDLDLNYNNIVDISFITPLTRLQYLCLTANRELRDYSPLLSLKYLRKLDLQDCYVPNIKQLKTALKYTNILGGYGGDENEEDDDE